MIRLFRKKADDISSAPSRQVIVAPDKFKGTLSAKEVTALIAEAARNAIGNADVRECPMADGGEGSAALIASLRNLHRLSVPGHNAMMHPADITYYAGDDVCAVDSAAIVGLAQLAGTPLQPWLATSYGIGEFIRLMLSRGMKEIIIGIGGTATVDGGIGMLQALGARFYDADGEELSHIPLRACDLSSVYTVDFSGVPRAELRQAVCALADVDVPLLPTGKDHSHNLSSLSFARQKGVGADELPLLQSALENYVCAIDTALYPPAEQPRFQGAGGGLGYAIHRVLKCRCRPGADYFISKYHIFPDRDTAAAGSTPDDPPEDASPFCIITGEGCLDEQSLEGKVTGALYRHASGLGIPTIIVCGKSTLDQTYPLMEIIPLTDVNAPDSRITHDTALENLTAAMPILEKALRRLYQ